MWSLLLGTCILYSVLLLPYVRTYHIKEDDFALILDSARQYHPHPALWITHGFSNYFVNYPDLPQHGTHFCRPVANATFWLESLLSPGTGPLNLTTNLLGLAITLVLFTFFLRRETSGDILFLSSIWIVYALSAMWYQPLLLSAFRTSLLMVLFALAAFLLLPSEGARHQGLRIGLSTLCQLASLLSHETGVVTPVIAALLFVLRRDGRVVRGRLKVLPVFLLPLLCFAAVRLMFYAGVGHTYALEHANGWAWKGMMGAAELLAKAFFPWSTAAATNGGRRLQVVVGVLMNLAGYALVAYALLRSGREGRGRLLRVLICLGIALGALCIAPATRLMLLAGVFGALAVVVAAEQISQAPAGNRARRGVALALVGLAFAGLWIFLSGFPQTVREGGASNQLARVEFEGLRTAIATTRAPTVLLVNDQAAKAGSRAMLEMAAWANRQYVYRLITLDSLDGRSGPQSNLSITRHSDAVRIEICAGADQAFVFVMVDEGRLRNQFINQGLRYEIETVPHYSTAASILHHLNKGVEPDEAALGRRLVVTVPPEIASKGLLIVGFDPRDTSTFSNDLLTGRNP
jgi:hypothetical protein